MQDFSVLQEHPVGFIDKGIDLPFSPLMLLHEFLVLHHPYQMTADMTADLLEIHLTSSLGFVLQGPSLPASFASLHHTWRGYQ